MLISPTSSASRGICANASLLRDAARCATRGVTGVVARTRTDGSDSHQEADLGWIWFAEGSRVARVPEPPAGILGQPYRTDFAPYQLPLPQYDGVAHALAPVSQEAALHHVRTVEDVLVWYIANI
jgi:hypothetical protein